MNHIPVQEQSSTQHIDVTQHPDFKQNRAMVERAERMIGDDSLPEVARTAAKSELIHYAMKNIRQFDPFFKGQQKLLEEGPNADELLLEAVNPDEDTQTPEHIRMVLRGIEEGESVDDADEDQELVAR